MRQIQSGVLPWQTAMPRKMAAENYALIVLQASDLEADLQ
jgi:hypothetical protein